MLGRVVGVQADDRSKGSWSNIDQQDEHRSKGRANKPVACERLWERRKEEEEDVGGGSSKERWEEG